MLGLKVYMLVVIMMVYAATLEFCIFRSIMFRISIAATAAKHLWYLTPHSTTGLTGLSLHAGLLTFIAAAIQHIFVSFHIFL